MLKGLLAWQDKFPNPYRLAEMARYIELNHLKVVCGYQDAYMCTFGGLNYMDFRGKQFYREAEAELMATIEPLAPYVERLPFVLGFTGVRHSSGAVHKPIRERWLEGESGGGCRLRTYHRDCPHEQEGSSAGRLGVTGRVDE